MTAAAHDCIPGLVAPSRRTLILGTGVLTLGAGFAASTAPASAAPILRKGSQLLIATSNGALSYILNTSTGSGERYYSGGRWKRATTPTGDFRIYRLHSRGWQEGPLGNMYRPGYYDRGWAIHGSASIPSYPASHGCSRISVAASDMLWSRSWFINGRRVLIY